MRIKDSWTSHYRLFTKGLTKENGVSERAKHGTEKGYHGGKGGKDG